VVNLATVTLKQSDLTGVQGPDEEFGRLVVRNYPGVEGARQLDVRPEEVSDIKTVADLIELDYYAPGSGDPKRLVVNKDDFDQLTSSNMAEVLAGARTLRGRPSQGGR
jgi:hypothetical protein